jgi:hypothetical protein
MAFPNTTQLAVLRVLAQADTWVPASNRTVAGPKPTVNATTAEALVSHYMDPRRQLVEAWYPYDQRRTPDGRVRTNTTGKSHFRITEAGKAKLAKLDGAP